MTVHKSKYIDLTVNTPDGGIFQKQIFWVAREMNIDKLLA
jgi:hypothetical protein